MLTRTSFDYAVLRVVPRVDREEFVNAGVILFCLQRRFLGARVHVDDSRLRALWPDLDIELIRSRLEAVVRISTGAPDAGPVGQLTQRQRFHWLVAPRSTILQVSPVHTGMCDVPQEWLDKLFQQLIVI